MQARTLRRLVAVMVATALVAGCTAEPDRQADPGDPSGVSGGWSAENLPALAGTDATGPAVPVLEGVVLDGSLGLSTSTVPVLSMAEPPAGATRFEWTMTDLSGTESVFATTTSEARVRVADGALVDGGAYVWSVKASAPGAAPVEAGPFVVNVDTQREGRQPAFSPAGVTVAAVSGEPVWTWDAPALGTATGTVSWGLSWRPTTAAPGGDTASVPAGWNLQVAGPTWDRLEVQAGGVVALRNRMGTTVTFREQDEGLYEAVWGPGQSWPSGQFSTLVRNPDDTWTVTDLNRVVTTFAAAGDDGVARPSAVWSADSAQLRMEYSDGRLSSLVDEVSGRAITFAYGGGDCPAGGGNGFVDVPDGQLCGVRTWDGATTALRYVTAGDTVQLGRIVAYSGTGETAQVTDVAWDAAGRMAAVRTPLGSSAVAAGAIDGLGDQDDRALTQISYDDQGRVETVTAPAPLVTGGVTADPSQSARATWAVSYEAPGVTSLQRVGVDTPAGFVRRVVADPATMLTAESTNAAGATETTEWDLATSSPTSFTADNGLVTRTDYDASGMPIEQRGPIAADLVDSDAAPRVATRYDETFADNPDGTPYTGLAVTYWANEQHAGTPASADTGPSFDGVVVDSLAFNWPDSPTGDSGWSARLAGKVAIATEGTHRFTAGRTARLWINGLLCDPDCSQELKEGEASIRVDVTSAGAATGLDVQWTPPQGQAGPLPTSVLRPAYNVMAAQTVTDATSLADPVEITSTATYDNPASERIVAMASSSGLVGSRTYEPFDPEAGDWARPTGYADPSGAVSTIDYWGDDEQASAGCDGAGSANQAGMARLVSQPGGAVPRSMTYDDAGRVVSMAVADGPATCITHDAAGRPIAITYPSIDGAPAMEVVFDYTDGNNPLVATTTSTVGDTTTTTRVVIDLLGRTVQSTDAWGTVTTTTYDPLTGGVATEVARTAGGQGASNTYTYNPTGTLASVAADGATVATYSYDPSGRMTEANLGDGTVGTMGYDALGNLDTLTWTSPDGTVRSAEEVFASSGRVLQRTLTGPDGASTYTYGYDTNGRLTSATLDTPLAVGARSWAYEFEGAEGAAANRTAQVVDGRRITYAYDDQHRLTTTDDPSLAGEITYDSRGNTTRLGPLTMTYNARGTLASATDGTTTLTYLTSGAATIGQQVTTGAGTSEIRFSSLGLQLDTEGQVVGRSLSLAPGVTVSTSVGGPTSWALPDLRGNATWTVGTAGTTLYDPFGQRISAPAGADGDGAAPAPAASSGALPAPAAGSDADGAAGGDVSTTTTVAAADDLTTTTLAAGAVAADESTTTTAVPDGSTTTTAVPDGSTTTTAVPDESTTTTAVPDESTTTTAVPDESTTTTAAPDESTTTTAAPDDEPGVVTSAGDDTPDARPAFGWHGASGVTTLPLEVTLLTMGMRTYVPALGRFLESDPVVNGGANPYAYTNGDPINGHDPSGTTDSWWGPIIGAVVSIAVGAVIGLATAGMGTVGMVLWGVTAAAIGGALGEATSEAISTGTVNFATVGYAALVDAALALATFGVARAVRGRQLAKASAARSGPVATAAADLDELPLLDPQFLNLGDAMDPVPIINRNLGKIGEFGAIPTVNLHDSIGEMNEVFGLLKQLEPPPFIFEV